MTEVLEAERLRVHRELRGSQVGLELFLGQVPLDDGGDDVRRWRGHVARLYAPAPGRPAKRARAGDSGAARMRR